MPTRIVERYEGWRVLPPNNALERHPVCVAYDVFRHANPQLFDCTTLNMHPAHHRYLANRLQEAYESGWNASEHARRRQRMNSN